MNNDKIKELFLSSASLPPTLALELVENLEFIPPDQVAWLITLVTQAEKADRDYLTAAKNFLKVSTERRQALEGALTKRADEIMAQFDRELADFDIAHLKE